LKHDYTLFGRRIDLTIAIGLLLAVLILVFFSWLASEVIPGTTMAFDMAGREAIHGHASVPLTVTMWGVTMLGSTAVLAPVGIIVFVAWFRRGRRRAAYLFAIAIAGAILLDITLKEVFRRPRPSAAFFGYALPSTYSFPSGHALQLPPCI
jgi:membrane-associated phospholipid phosphatase